MSGYVDGSEYSIILFVSEKDDVSLKLFDSIFVFILENFSVIEYKL